MQIASNIKHFNSPLHGSKEENGHRNIHMTKFSCKNLLDLDNLIDF